MAFVGLIAFDFPSSRHCRGIRAVRGRCSSVGWGALLKVTCYGEPLCGRDSILLNRRMPRIRRQAIKLRELAERISHQPVDLLVREICGRFGMLCVEAEAQRIDLGTSFVPVALARLHIMVKCANWRASVSGRIGSSRPTTKPHHT